MSIPWSKYLVLDAREVKITTKWYPVTSRYFTLLGALKGRLDDGRIIVQVYGVAKPPHTFVMKRKGHTLTTARFIDL